MTYSIGPIPTQAPKQGSSYTPQLTGGQIYNDGNVNWDTWNKGWNEGYNNAGKSYSGTDQNFGKGYLVGQQEYAKRTNTTPTSPQPNNTNTINTMVDPNNPLAGFDMKYYTGWNDVKSAQDDWIATKGAKANTSGGGGGGGAGGDSNAPVVPAVDKTVSIKNDPRAAIVTSNPDSNQDFVNSGMDMDTYLATIDQEYAGSDKLLNEQEATLRADQPGILQGITNQANLLKNKAYNIKEDAQSAAKRLYSELQQGYRQRFGGASSAGEAAQALTGAEQQRQMAQNNRTYQESVAQVDLSADEGIRASQSEFRNSLLEIDKNRTLLASQKLVAKRAALDKLAETVRNIQAQRQQLKDNITLMQEQARLQQETNLKNMTTNPDSNLTFNNQPTTASGNVGIGNAIGYMGTGMAKNENPLGSGILGQYNPNSKDYFLNSR